EGGITGVERLIPELQVQQAMIVARSRFGDYFRPAVPDAAELRTEWIIADADFLNLVLWRDAATGEPIDYKSGVAAGAATRARNFLQILREFVFVIRQRIDELFTKNRCLKTRIRIDADLVARFGNFDVLRDLRERHSDGKRPHIGRDLHHFRIGIEIRGR